ncbi:hypothetical protein Tco_0555833 [Tanacetum coccineum]
MALPVQPVNNSIFRLILEKEKLFGLNFLDWYHNLRIVLKAKKKLTYLEQPIPHIPTHVPLTTENSKDFNANDMLKELKTMFSQQFEQEVHEIVKAFHACKQEEWHFVSSYVLEIKGYMDQLECLGHPISLHLGTIDDLHAMLKLHENRLPKKADVAHVVLAIKGGKIQKNNKNKKLQAAHRKGLGKVDHWRRNCPVYLFELIKKKKNISGVSTSGIFVIELYSFPNKSWVYDTGYGTHICNTTQGLRGSKKLKSGTLNLYIGN